MIPVCIHTLGDSTLDNLFWGIPHTLDAQKAKSDSVEGQLQTLCNTDATRHYEVISHAYDGFTTKSVLKGDIIGRVLPNDNQIKTTYLREKVQDGQSFVRPLDELKKSIEGKPHSEHYVVLSVGGNDFRENLSNPLKLLWDIASIQKRYVQIVQEIQSIPYRDVRPILMLQYKTDKNYDPDKIYPLMQGLGIFARCVQCAAFATLFAVSTFTVLGKISLVSAVIFSALSALGLYVTNKVSPITRVIDLFRGKIDPVETFDRLAEAFYKPILAYAKEHKIPVLDLTHTFDPTKPLYKYGIEPNVEGGKLIAEGIHHIIMNHKFSSPSRVYAKPPGSGSYVAKEIIYRTFCKKRKHLPLFNRPKMSKRPLLFLGLCLFFLGFSFFLFRKWS